MIALSTIFKGLAQVYALAEPVGNAVAALMEAAEAASNVPGATKKQAVIEGVKAFLAAIGLDFDSLASVIQTLIDGAKAAYNAIMAARSDAAPDSPSGPVVVA